MGLIPCCFALVGIVNFRIFALFSSLRSTGTYIGAKRLKEFAKRATFIMVSRQLNESLARFEKSN
ncbi:MAG: hypothetical protein U9R00_01755 [Patescibacteria group bacterium]|nr:hypothetical protein [Patescibacteria group bacterium]